MSDFVRVIERLEEAVLTHVNVSTALDDVAVLLGFDHFCFLRPASKALPADVDPVAAGEVTTLVSGDWDVVGSRDAEIGRVSSGRLLLQRGAMSGGQAATGEPATGPLTEACYIAWSAQMDDTPWTLALVRRAGRGPASLKEMQEVRDAAPAISRALRMMHRLRHAQIRGIFNGLTAARSAAILLSPDGKVTTTTPRAERLFGLDFAVRDGSLWSAHPATHNCLDQLADIVRERRFNSLAPFLIRRFAEKHSIVAHPVLLRGMSAELFCTADVALFLITPDQNEIVGRNYLELLFGLSQAEAQIATMLAEGLEPQQIAERRKVSVGTTRVQIKSIFQKTNVHRQAELIKIVSALSSPMIAG